MYNFKQRVTIRNNLVLIMYTILRESNLCIGSIHLLAITVCVFYPTMYIYNYICECKIFL